MTLPLDVVILAAGQGKRMNSALPKVLHPIAGKSLLVHVLDTAGALSPRRVAVVYGHGGETVPTALADRPVEWALQEPQLGTGHAVAQALPKIAADGIVLVLYGDVPLTRADTLRSLVQAADADTVALLTVDLSDPTGYGRILRDAMGQVTGIVEQKDATPEQRAIRETNTGIMALPGARLGRWLSNLSNDNAQGEYYLTDVIAAAVAEGCRIVTRQPGNEWESAGVNSKRQLAELERRHQLNLAYALLERGVTLADPARIDIRGTLECGRDVTIDVGCVFEGTVVLGDRVKVGAYCTLRDTEVGLGTELLPYSTTDQSTIGPECRVGPYARLRPGAQLAADAHVGNFVEIKNSTIGRGSKANHLAYVGDATVGADVNIGAGTITCNYDGANKHRTVIEDGAFIGSDTQLVAPVTVGRGATLGAGTTLTEDAPPNALTISRPRQITLPDWRRPTRNKK
jgi:bifunctional UDP-N-acetylglucosamine pyrophosphorylase / glucosamine-1-phosphate N-acetyltransferase